MLRWLAVLHAFLSAVCKSSALAVACTKRPFLLLPEPRNTWATVAKVAVALMSRAFFLGLSLLFPLSGCVIGSATK
jgi:hypothetical protein